MHQSIFDKLCSITRSVFFCKLINNYFVSSFLLTTVTAMFCIKKISYFSHPALSIKESSIWKVINKLDSSNFFSYTRLSPKQNTTNVTSWPRSFCTKQIFAFLKTLFSAIIQHIFRSWRSKNGKKHPSIKLHLTTVSVKCKTLSKALFFYNATCHCRLNVYGPSLLA